MTYEQERNAYNFTFFFPPGARLGNVSLFSRFLAVGVTGPRLNIRRARFRLAVGAASVVRWRFFHPEAAERRWGPLPCAPFAFPTFLLFIYLKKDTPTGLLNILRAGRGTQTSFPPEIIVRGGKQ